MLHLHFACVPLTYEHSNLLWFIRLLCQNALMHCIKFVHDFHWTTNECKKKFNLKSSFVFHLHGIREQPISSGLWKTHNSPSLKEVSYVVIAYSIRTSKLISLQTCMYHSVYVKRLISPENSNWQNHWTSHFIVLHSILSVISILTSTDRVERRSYRPFA